MKNETKVQVCRLCHRAVNTTRPRGAEETDTGRTAQDSTTAGQKEGVIVRTEVNVGGPPAPGSDAGTRAARWSFSGKEEKETSGRSDHSR